jgi:hypothetical protein
MRTISAVDSVSLAIQRTRDFLFRPFTWGTFLKLGLVAIITDGLGSNLRSSNSSTSHEHRSVGNSTFNFSPGWTHPAWLTPGVIAAIGVAVLFGILFSLVVFYLITRLRFAYFHCLTTNTRQIRTGWEIYRSQAMRFFGLNLVVGLCFLVVMGLIAIPFAGGFLKLFEVITQGGKPDIGSILLLVLPLIPIILLLALAAGAAEIILRDWMLPHIALEDATAGEAWESVWARIRAEKKEFFVYVLLRVALPILGAVCLLMVLIIPGLALAGSLAAVELGLHSYFADATGSSALVGVLLEGFFGVLAFGFALVASICLGGPLSTGIREYALIFYGGRYPVLGNLLYAAPAPPLAAGPAGLA